MRGESAYAGAMRGLREDRIVVCTPGVKDGHPVLCTSLFAPDQPHDGALYDPDPDIRAAFLLGISMAAHDDLRDNHGIRCA